MQGTRSHPVSRSGGPSIYALAYRGMTPVLEGGPPFTLLNVQMSESLAYWKAQVNIDMVRVSMEGSDKPAIPIQLRGNQYVFGFSELGVAGEIMNYIALACALGNHADFSKLLTRLPESLPAADLRELETQLEYLASCEGGPEESFCWLVLYGFTNKESPSRCRALMEVGLARLHREKNERLAKLALRACLRHAEPRFWHPLVDAVAKFDSARLDQLLECMKQLEVRDYECLKGKKLDFSEEVCVKLLRKAINSAAQVEAISVCLQEARHQDMPMFRLETSTLLHLLLMEQPNVQLPIDVLEAFSQSSQLPCFYPKKSQQLANGLPSYFLYYLQQSQVRVVFKVGEVLHCTDFKQLGSSGLWAGCFPTTPVSRFRVLLGLGCGLMLPDLTNRSLPQGTSSVFFFNVKFEAADQFADLGSPEQDPITQLSLYLQHLAPLSIPQLHDLLMHFRLLYPAIELWKGSQHLARGLGELEPLGAMLAVGFMKEDLLRGFPFLLQIGLARLSKPTELQCSDVQSQLILQGCFLLFQHSFQSHGSDWLQVFRFLHPKPREATAIVNFFKQLPSEEIEIIAQTLITAEAEFDLEMQCLLVRAVKDLHICIELVRKIYFSRSTTPERCIAMINEFCATVKIPAIHVPAVIQLVCKDTDFRATIIESSNLLQALWTAGTSEVSIEKMPIYEVMLLSDLQFPQAHSFARELILRYHFPLVQTYRTFSKFYGEFISLFREWLSVPQDNLQRWAGDLEIAVKECREVGLSGPIEEEAARSLTSTASTDQVLRLALTFNFNILKDAFIEVCKERVRTELSHNNTLFANTVLRQLIAVSVRTVYCQPDIILLLINTLDNLDIASDEAAREAVLIYPGDNQYLTTLFNYLEVETSSVQACKQSCLSLAAEMKAGGIAYRTLESLTERSFEILHAAIGKDPRDIAQTWMQRLRDMESQCQALEHSLAQFFPTATFDLVLWRCIRSRNPHYSTMAVADILQLPEHVNELQRLLEQYQGLNQSVLYRNHLQVECEQAPRVTEEVAVVLLNRSHFTFVQDLQSVTQHPDTVSLSHAIGLFGDVEDIAEELAVLREYLRAPGLLEALRQAMENNRLRIHMKNFCGALISLGPLIELTCAETQAVCESFLSIRNDQTKLQVFNTACDRLMGLFDFRSSRNVSYVNLLKTLAEENNLVDYLKKVDEELFHLLDELAGTSKVKIDKEVTDQFHILFDVVSAISKKAHFRDLLASLNQYFDRPRGISVESAINSVKKCKQHLPELIDAESSFTSMDPANAQLMQNTLENSQAIFNIGIEVGVTIIMPGTGKPLSFEEIREMQARSNLILHSAEVGFEVENKEYIENFSKITEVFFTCINHIEELQDIGAQLPSSQTCAIQQSQSSQAHNFQQTLKSSVQEWKVALQKPRTYELTYLHGPHMWMMEGYLAGEEANQQQARNWLRVMGKMPSSSRVLSELKQEPDARMAALSEALRKLKDDGARRMEAWCESTFPVRPSSLIIVQSKKRTEALISIYVRTGKAFPSPDQVLICRPSTQTCELRSFLMHWMLCPQEGQLFTLLNCEKLKMAVQAEGSNIIEEFTTHTSRAMLAVVTEDARCQLVRSLSDRMGVNQLAEESLVTDFSCVYEHISPFVRVLDSQEAGYGKTTCVQQACGGKFTVLSVAGELDFDNLCATLCGLNLTNSALLVKLEFVESGSEEVLFNFLLQLLLLRACKSNTHFFFLPEKCTIFIEIGNTASRLWSVNNTVLRFFHIEHLPAPNLTSLELQDSELPVLCYLRDLAHNQSLLQGNPAVGRMSPQEVAQLIQQYFVQGCVQRGEHFSYRSIKTFLTLMSRQIVFMNGGAFAVACPELAPFRPTIFNLIVASSAEYTQKSVKTTSSQKAAALRGQSLPEEVGCTVSFHSSNHECVFFSKQSVCTYIYRQLQAATMKEVFESQRSRYLQFNASVPQLQDYQAMNSWDLTELLRICYCPEREVPAEAMSYVLTPDNFLKIHLIMVRMQAGLPVVVMGDSGCGKTALITYLATLLGEHLEVFNIHSGITLTDIRSRMAAIAANASTVQRLWVFFDEFNTTPFVSTISEIICDRMFEGRPISDNLVLLAACNPYKIKRAAVEVNAKMGFKRKTSQNLLHVVFPLPDSVIEYIWDYGTLQAKDLAAYITCILRNEKVPMCEESLGEQNFAALVSTAHSFIEQEESASSVSLRDVRRCAKMYHWFRESLETRAHLPIPDKRAKLIDDNKNLETGSNWLANLFSSGKPGATSKSFEQKAIMLAVYMCYVLRVSVASVRERLLEQLAAKHPFSQGLMALVEWEQFDLLARLELDGSIALNEAFRENVFALFVCIYNHIPVMLYGKPGCSKSLAYQVINQSCRHRAAKDAYLQQLPTIHLVYFQGSESCTSKAVLSCFQRAHGLVREGRVVMIVFDEIGLAEISHFNPLKVLHQELEMKDEDKALAFVGVSNWSLDASKMNRVLSVARPDPNDKEVKSTALSILKSLLPARFSEFAKLITAVADTYLALFTQQQDDYTGLRDFYHLIKLIVNSIQHADAEEVARLTKLAVYRNFGGKERLQQDAWKLLVEKHPPFRPYQDLPAPDVVTLVRSNLSDSEARYLMLISDGELSREILKKYIGLDIKLKEVMQGSTFEQDKHSETYASRCLSDIILFMERGYSVVLKDMNHIYSSLYDLFNQNFGSSKWGKYCRIALGVSFLPRCVVHKDFRLIVLETSQGVLTKDAAFLNRFEKHLVQPDNFLPEHARVLAQEIEVWVNSFFQGKKVLIDLAHVFPTYSQLAVSTAILTLETKSPDRRGDISNQVKRWLIAAAPADFVVLSALQDIGIEWREEWRWLHQRTFDNLLKGIRRSTKALHVLYTYGEKGLPPERKYSSTFKSEEELCNDIKQCDSNSTAWCYFLLLDYSAESQHLPTIKHVLSRAAACYKLKFCLIVVMKRHLKCEATAPNFEEWEVASMSCDSLLAYTYTEDMLRASTKDLLRGLDPDSKVKLSKSMCERALLLLKYDVPDFDVNKHLFAFREALDVQKELASALWEKISEVLKDETFKTAEWKEMVLMNKMCCENSSSLEEAINFAMQSPVKKAMAAVFFEIEKKFALRSFLTCWSENEGQTIRQIWLQQLHYLRVDSRPVDQLQGNLMRCAATVDFPFITDEYNLLSELREASWEEFVSAFNNRSVVRSVVSEMNGSQRLQQLYFQDLATLALTHHSIEITNRAYICGLVGWLVEEHRGTGIIAKAFVFAKQLDFLIQLCRLSHCYRAYTDLAELFPLVARYPPVRNELVLPLQGVREVYLNKMPVLLDSEPDSNRWKAQVEEKINASILDLCRLSKSKTTPLAFINLLLKCEKVLLQFHMPFSNLEMLRFLIRLPPFHDKDIDVFRDVVGLLTSKSKAGRSNLDENSTFTTVTNKLTSHYKKNPTIVYPFFAYYYAYMIRKDDSYVKRFAEFLEKKPEFWRFASSAVTSVAKTFHLHRICTSLIGREISLADFSSSRELDRLNSLLQRGSSRRLTVLLCDSCAAAFSLYKRPLELYIPAFYDCLQLLTDFPPESLQVVLASSFIKWVLERFSEQLCSGAAQEEVRQEISKAILGSPYTGVLGKICLKQAKAMCQRDSSKWLNFLRANLDLPWLEGTSLIKELESQMPFYFPINHYTPKSTFAKTSNYLDTLRHSREANLEEVIPEDQSPDTRMQFGLAFIEKIARWPEESTDYLKAWLRRAEARLERVFGQEMVELVREVLSHRIDPSRPIIEMHQIITRYLLLLIITAYNRTPGPLTSIFFNRKGEIATHFAQYFIVGAPNPLLIEYLYYVSTNLQQIKFTALYVCSSDCEYIYSVGNCGMPMETSTCPYCHRDVGGRDHHPVARAGHRQVSDQEAQNLARTSVQRYMQSGQLPGLLSASVNLNATEMRGMKGFTNVLLHNFVIQYLNFLASFKHTAVTAMLNQGDLKFLTERLTENQTTIYNFLSSCSEPYLVLYKILSELPAFLLKFPQVPSSPNTRSRFEAEFDVLVSSTIANIPVAVQTFKAVAVQKQLRAQISLDEGDDDHSLLAAFFRSTEVPMLELLESTWNLSPQREEYPIIDASLKVLGLYSKISPLRDIVRFTNYLREHYNHRIHREEARINPISLLLQKDTRAQQLYQDFRAAWASLSIDLQADCKPLKKDDLKLNEDCSLINLLLDTTEMGGGLYLYAAIKNLAEQQNNLVNMLVAALAQFRECAPRELLSDKPCAVQAMSTIPFCHLNDPVFLAQCAICNPDYGGGRELVFDFHRIQLALINDILNLQVLDFSTVDLFQYQFEMLNMTSQHSSAIIDIRKAIPQDPLPNSLSETLKTHIAKLKLQSRVFLQNVHGGLEQLLCFLRNISFPPDTQVAKIVNALRQEQSCKLLLELAGELKVRYILSFYEFIEELYFPIYTEYIRAEYRAPYDFFDKVVPLLKKVQSVETTQTVLRKFIMRCLTGELPPRQALGLYLGREDFWPVPVDERRQEQVLEVLMDVPIGAALQLHGELAR